MRPCRPMKFPGTTTFSIEWSYIWARQRVIVTDFLNRDDESVPKWKLRRTPPTSAMCGLYRNVSVRLRLIQDPTFP